MGPLYIAAVKTPFRFLAVATAEAEAIPFGYISAQFLLPPHNISCRRLRLTMKDGHQP